MGIIAQNSADLHFSRLVVEPSGSRRFSLAADGVHLINCRGAVSFDACRFQNQFDDAINIHSLYHQIVRVPDSRTLRVRTLHAQHQGVMVHRPGDILRFCRHPEMLPIAELPLTVCRPLNSETFDLGFDAGLPAGIAPGDFVENTSACAVTSIRDCTFRWNRARGVLLNGNLPIHVENNVFETPGTAILVESSSVWGEAGPLGELRIIGNKFHGCTTCPGWGDAVIQAVPDFRIGAPGDLPPFHGRLVVRGNLFSGCLAPPLRTLSFAGVESDLPDFPQPA